MITQNLKSFLTNMFLVIQSLPVKPPESSGREARRNSFSVHDSIQEASNEESSVHPSSQKQSSQNQSSSNNNSSMSEPNRNISRDSRSEKSP